MYTIYINNTLPPALAVHEIYRDIFGPPMVKVNKLKTSTKYFSSTDLHPVNNIYILSETLKKEEIFHVNNS